MATEVVQGIGDQTPRDNFSQGFLSVDIPELGTPVKGKVRDNWLIGPNYRVMVTTDRQSAYDRLICTVPGKGRVLNLLSEFWMNLTSDIIPNQMVSVPHPNVLIAKQAKAVLPVEVVLRRYMAKSSTTTSVYHNYTQGRRDIYGLHFPEGLLPNQEFPMGTILTPTTKAATGHDEELTDGQAAEMVDNMLGEGVWDAAKNAAFKIFERGRKLCMDKGLILVDTKYEFGLDKDGNLMLIDEVHTPDSSRFWLAETYPTKFEKGETPDTFDKEILRRWLAEQNFKGEGPVPKVDPQVIGAMEKAYAVPYRMVTERFLPHATESPAEIAKIAYNSASVLIQSSS